MRQLSGKVELPLDSLPMLVRFRDPSDPLTVERVNPNNLPEQFGKGVKLTRATLQVAPASSWFVGPSSSKIEPIVTGIESKLPWWNAASPWLKPLGNGVFEDTRRDSLRIEKADFKRDS